MTTGEIDKSKRKLLTTAATVAGGAAVIATAIPFIKGMLPSERTKVAGSSVTADLGKLEMGKQVTLKWRGKPIWILRRTPQMLENLDRNDLQLRDPLSKVESQQPSYVQNPTRSINPEIFVCIGLCTHLGCVPNFRPDIHPSDLGDNWLGGYFCPCHGSRFDLAGRVYKSVPAPANLVIPPHRYINNNSITIGEDNI